MVTNDDRATVSTRLHLLNAISLAINSTSNLGKLFESIYEQIHAIIPLSEFYIGRYTEATALVEWLFALESGQLLAPLTVSRPDAAIKEALLRVTVAEEKEHGLGRNKKIDAVKEIIAPMLFQNEVVGVLCACSVDDRIFSPNDESFFAVLACHLAQVLQHTFGDGVSGGVELLNKYDEIEKKNRKLVSIIEIARSIAHEFNQPLTGISGYCTLIKEELGDASSRIFQDITEIQKQSARLEDLVYKFQNIAHVEYLERVGRDD